MSDQNRLTKFWHELKRRKVVGVIVVYATVAFILMQLAQILEGALNLPAWFDTVITIALIIGFPIAIIFSWIFDVSSKGISVTEPEVSKDRIESNKQIAEKSIIVLPFDNISSDTEQEYFSDGLTEEIITDLSYINDLLVISRSSAMTFKGSKQTIKEIAGKVNVRYVLEGSVRKSENDLRIVAQLIDAKDDSHVWAEKYSGKLDDIFDIQENVSRSIANALKIKLSDREKEKIEQRPIDNAFAYDCYRRAYPEISSMFKERIDYGLNLLQKGLEVTGENSVIYGGIGAAYMQYANIGFQAEDSITKAEEFLQKALKLDPELPEAQFLLGLVNILSGETILIAIKHLKRAHISNSDDPEIMIYLALLYVIAGQNEEAQQLVNTIARIDPINPMCDAVTGWVHFFSGRYKMALDPLFAAYRLTPDSPMHQFFKALILFYNDQADEAYDFIVKVVDESTRNTWTWLTLFIKYAIKKDSEKVIALMKTPNLVPQMQMDLQNSFHIATFYAHMNKKEEALKWLENAVSKGFINYPLLNEQDILLENIREEKKFKELIKKVKEQWENFEV